MHLGWDEIVPKLKSAVLAAGIVFAAANIAEAGCAQMPGRMQWGRPGEMAVLMTWLFAGLTKAIVAVGVSRLSLPVGLR
jgi:hypothetical protein